MAAGKSRVPVLSYVLRSGTTRPVIVVVELVNRSYGTVAWPGWYTPLKDGEASAAEKSCNRRHCDLGRCRQDGGCRRSVTGQTVETKSLGAFVT